MRQLLLSVLLFISFFSFAQCPEGQVLLRSQDEVAQFQIDFPNCSELESGLTINGNDIQDLTPLSQLTSVQQALTIIDNPNLVSLAGLENITTFRYTMPPPPAPPQTGNISIINNTLLEDFDELSNIVPITTNGFIALTLEVKDNQSLTNLAGFAGVSEAISLIDVTNNIRLDNLSGIQNISFTLGMRLEENTLLADITAITNYTIGNSGISVRDNSSLSQCAVESVCNAIADNPDNVAIENNGADCMTFEEVQTTCNTLGVENALKVSDIILTPNPVIKRLTINTLENTFIKAVMYSIAGEQLFTTTDMHIDMAAFQSGIYLISIETEDGTATTQIIKY